MSKPPETWKPPTELEVPLPRPVCLKRGGVWLLVLSGVLVLAGAALASGIARASRQHEADARRMLAEGRQTEGVVTRLWRTDDDSDEHRVAYQFPLDGLVYGGEAAIDSRHWDRLREGSTILVRYLPYSPGHNYPSGDLPHPTPAWVVFLVGGIPTLGGALLPLTVWRRRDLLARGLPTRAVVTRVGAKQAGDSGVQYTVDYQFPLPGGGCANSSYNVNSNPHSEGSAFCVLYDPENPRRHVRYPSALVRVAPPYN